jgi:hypothetical protein
LVNRSKSSNKTSGFGDFLDGLFGGGKKQPGTKPGKSSGWVKPASVARPAQSGTKISGNAVGRRLMSDLQRDFGLTKVQAAGVVGNLDHESAGFRSLQEINPLVKGSRGGYGYAQWTGPRRRQFEAWAAKHGLSTASYEANYGFLKHELTSTSESRVLGPLRRAQTVEQAAIVFSGSSQRGNAKAGFLRPGIPHFASRIARAKRYA